MLAQLTLYEVNLLWPTDTKPRISYKDSLRKKLFEHQTVMNDILEVKGKTVLNNVNDGVMDT